MKGLNQIFVLSWLYLYTKVKPKTWLRPFVNMIPDICSISLDQFVVPVCESGTGSALLVSGCCIIWSATRVSNYTGWWLLDWQDLHLVESTLVCDTRSIDCLRYLETTKALSLGKSV